MIELLPKWLMQHSLSEIRLDPNDARKRVYRLESSNHVIEEIEKGVK